jgi:ubiquinone/menaquinone biosynthesis C-methylase UbiE
MTDSPGGFLCPACRSAVEAREGGFACSLCGRFYPILFGIPDFRLQGDRYLSLEDERAKAARLHDYGRTHDLKALIDFYYSITDDVPARLVPVFANYLVNAPRLSMPALRALAPDGGRALLDLGCGSGGALVVAADSFEERTGIDIALRWLVIARKRLDEAGVTATLVCADAEALPLRNATYSHVLASYLLEHGQSPGVAVKCAATVLEQGGRLYISSGNRHWIGPHAATGVWAAGLLPRRLRASLLTRRHGVDILRAVSFVSPGSLRRWARAAGLRQIDAAPLQAETRHLDGRSWLFRTLARTYSVLTKVPVIRTVLLFVGPQFQVIFVKETT